uniref:Placenta associated 8, tandem duplicate 1 n=1 Tax=Oryzias latipes TaxID=8090 RepID=A0A3B3IEY8_ORYLA
MAVINQPGKFQPSDFQTDVCDCCDDVKICLCGCFCYLCLGCTIASDMGECCMFGTGYPIRSVYRTRYNIKVSLSARGEQRRSVSASQIYRFHSKTWKKAL